MVSTGEEMTCYFCGDETEDVVETDLPLGRGKQLEYKKAGICNRERCRKMLERRLNGGDTNVQLSAMSGKS